MTFKSIVIPVCGEIVYEDLIYSNSIQRKMIIEDLIYRFSIYYMILTCI